ncbi:MAG: hypothetical protein QM682_08630 [Paracoccus sp. (in: a-proteobacteria)]|uniref:hypothetical protein n=1 Tax=Paracoccus sp. TaxID=267 RepID=UPI0039E70F3A
MDRLVCNRNCWVSGAIAGVVVLLFTSGIGDLAWGGGLFLGIVTGVLFGAMMVWLVCQERPDLVAGPEGLTRTDWEREVAERQPEALLVSSVGPEAVSFAAQMPLVAGAMPKVAAQAPEPQAAVSDDLRQIKGVGPKLSDWLHENGVTRFAQIAAWDAAQVADFAQRLGRMGGRIETDDWVGQARILAQGGKTEHSRKVERGEAT